METFQKVTAQQTEEVDISPLAHSHLYFIFPVSVWDKTSHFLYILPLTIIASISYFLSWSQFRDCKFSASLHMEPVSRANFFSFQRFWLPFQVLLNLTSLRFRFLSFPFLLCSGSSSTLFIFHPQISDNKKDISLLVKSNEMSLAEHTLKIK